MSLKEAFVVWRRRSKRPLMISPGGNGDLGETAQRCSLGQADKGYERFAEEIHFPHQDVGSLGIPGYFLHEFIS